MLLNRKAYKWKTTALRISWQRPNVRTNISIGCCYYCADYDLASCNGVLFHCDRVRSVLPPRGSPTDNYVHFGMCGVILMSDWSFHHPLGISPAGFGNWRLAVIARRYGDKDMMSIVWAIEAIVSCLPLQSSGTEIRYYCERPTVRLESVHVRHIDSLRTFATFEMRKIPQSSPFEQKLVVGGRVGGRSAGGAKPESNDRTKLVICLES